MRRMIIMGVVIILLVLLLIFTLNRPKGDAASTVIPQISSVPTQYIPQNWKDWNNDGVVDERDAALHDK